MLGKPSDKNLVNKFGQNITDSINSIIYERTKRYNNDIIGVFIDSCTHHCVSTCKSWKSVEASPYMLMANGQFKTIGERFNHLVMRHRKEHLRTYNDNNNNFINLETAFIRWYLDDGNKLFDDNLKKLKHFYIQNNDFPCQDCCKCDY